MRRQEIETKRALKFCVDRERYLNADDTKRWQKRSSKCPVCKKKLNHRTKKANCCICGKLHCENCLRTQLKEEIIAYIPKDGVKICRLCLRHSDVLYEKILYRMRRETVAALLLQRVHRGKSGRARFFRIFEQHKLEIKAKKRALEKAKRYREFLNDILFRIRVARGNKDVPMLISIVSNHSDIAEIVSAGCDAVAGISTSIHAKRDICKAGALDMIIRMMGKYPNDLTIQIRGAHSIAFAALRCDDTKLYLFPRVMRLMYELEEKYPQNKRILAATSLFFDDLCELREHPTSEQLRQLGNEAHEYLENLRWEYSLKSLFLDEREGEKSQKEEEKLSGGDIIKCRQYFIESSSTKNLSDFTQSNLFALITTLIGHELTNRQKITLMETFNTSKRGIRSRSIVTTRKKNTFDCGEFCKFLCDENSPDWTRVFVRKVLMLSRYSTRRTSLVT